LYFKLRDDRLPINSVLLPALPSRP
jgi:hypothetical protein